MNEHTLSELSKIDEKCKIKLKNKKDSLLSGPDIIEVVLYGITSNITWEILKNIFYILNKNNAKINSSKTDLNKIGYLYFNDSSSDFNISINNDTTKIRHTQKSKTLVIKKNFEVFEEK